MIVIVSITKMLLFFYVILFTFRLTLKTDAEGALKGNQWPLSCYGPFRDKPCVPNFIEDQSFEEARHLCKCAVFVFVSIYIITIIINVNDRNVYKILNVNVFCIFVVVSV